MTTATPLILASASPRRRELLAWLGHPFTVLPSNADESIPQGVQHPAEIACQLARAKAVQVASQHPHAVVLAADTIVVLEGEILGKPADAEEARATLRRLRNRPHHVITAVAIARDSAVDVDHVSTAVIMRDYSDDEIGAYIASGDPFDKAGSYAIQDPQFDPVDHFEGCYCNVVGLPLLLVQRMLREFDGSLVNLYAPDLPPQCRACPFLVKSQSTTSST